ncbi:ABC transporter substrate-binding protein [Capillimicrobium parvum]|uniref:Leucine-, isoleucine-, valine-, threonine-, and alanine-binding protein n=1 Tax=Capillimicrobium parvum TaxID=2884022 RepID=A0A9E7BZ21_9ACTN|nr:ABC transporter substrate-binding protein [Capillimicrobium parvum]UGS34017.1 Leucine-, isoleucine-, valine-, threonine-, and alanine-binding protein [Capillimicrobium parvum]
MRRLLPLLTVLLSLLVPAAAFAALPAGEIRLGAVWSVTGAGASYAALQPAGAQLAVDEVNASGALGGARLALDERDDRSSASRAAELFTQLIDTGAVALLGPTLSNSALQADRVAQGRGVPVLGVSNTGDGVLDIGDVVFRDSLSERAVQPRTVAVTHRRLHYRRAAIVWATPDAYSKTGHDVFREALRGTPGVRIVADRSFASDSANGYRRALRRIARKRPDALFVSALAPDAVKVMKAARRIRALRAVPFIGGNAFNAPGLIAQGGRAAQGAISGAAWIATEDTPGNAAFVAAFRARFGTAPDQFAAQSYTGVKLLAEAIRRADSSDPRAIRDALAGLRDVDTVLGRFSFGPDREPQYTPVVQQIRGGRYVRIG